MGLLSPECVISHGQSNSVVQSVQGRRPMVAEALQVLHTLGTQGPTVQNPRLPHAAVLLDCGGCGHPVPTNRITSYDPLGGRGDGRTWRRHRARTTGPPSCVISDVRRDEDTTLITQPVRRRCHIYIRPWSCMFMVMCVHVHFISEDENIMLKIK